MKYLLIVLFLVLTGCSNEPEYKYEYGNCVEFKFDQRSFTCGKIGKGTLVGAYKLYSIVMYEINTTCRNDEIRIWINDQHIIGLCNDQK